MVVAVASRARATERKTRNHELDEDIVLNESSRAGAFKDCKNGAAKVSRCETRADKNGGRTKVAVLLALREDVEREGRVARLDELDHVVERREGHDREDRAKDLLCGRADLSTSRRWMSKDPRDAPDMSESSGLTPLTIVTSILRSFSSLPPPTTTSPLVASSSFDTRL